MEPFEEVTIDVIVETDPEDWPQKVHTDVVRIVYRPEFEAREPDVQVGVLPLDEREASLFAGAIHVNDAWSECVEGESCEVVMPILVQCNHRDTRCTGGVFVDAFLSRVKRWRWDQAPDESLVVDIAIP